MKLDVQNRTVVRGDEAIPLTKREFDLLNTLLSNMNQVMTREELLLQVWKYDDAIETNVVDVYIRYLRGKSMFQVRNHTFKQCEEWVTLSVKNE